MARRASSLGPGHARIMLNGRVCTTLGGTPGDHRSILNARAKMRRELRQIQEVT
jgi:hypothetical protein